MAKLTNVRERVHQPFRDTLIRTSGLYASNVQDRTDLFTQAGKNDAESNLKNGSTLPSDQSMVVLALRVFTWFRQSNLRCGLPITCEPRLLGKVKGPTGTVALRERAPEPPPGPITPIEDCIFNGKPFNGDLTLQVDKCPEAVARILDGSGGFPSYQDVYRLNWQAEEQLLWSFGSGQKLSLTSMPTAYFPYGGGLYGDMGGAGKIPFVRAGFDFPEIAAQTAIHWENGTPDHSGILRLARAILLPPRQNVLCQAQIVRLPDGGNAGTFGTTQGARNMLSLTSNLNAADLIQKVVSFTFDGLFSRDVQ